MYRLRIIASASLLLCLLGCKPEPSTPLATGSGKVAVEFPDGMTWFNAPTQTLSTLRGRVVLLFFFEVNSDRCLPLFAHLKSWQERYARHGLNIIGVHVPGYDFSLDPIHLSAALNRHGLKFPVVSDADNEMAAACAIPRTPSLLLIDRGGLVRLQSDGVNAAVGMEEAVQQLLNEPDRRIRFPRPLYLKMVTGDSPVTPELFLGRNGTGLADPEVASTNDITQFQLPGQLEEGRVYASGRWSLLSESLRHAADVDGMTDFLLVRYHGTEVRAVMRPEGIYWKQVWVKLDDKWIPRAIAGADIKYDNNGRSYLQVDQPRLYHLITGRYQGKHELRLYTQGKGLSVYSVSFR